MSRWLRFYDDAINDPKILKLSEDLRWHWVALLCVASKHDGVLPGMDDVSIMLRIQKSKAATIITQLRVAGLLDETETGFAPHNWNGRQYKSDVSTDRVKRFRDKKGNVSGNVSSALPKRPQITDTDTDTETEPETEKKETRSVALADGWPSDFREQFWAKWPNKVGKPKAIAKLEGCMKRGIAFVDILSGLDRYIATKPPDRPWLNPETFLNQERWTDQPASTGQPNGNRTPNSRTTGHDAILAAATRAAGKIPRDDELAGTGAEAEFPFGDGVDANRAPMDRRAHGRSEGFDNGREPAAGRVFEGEIIAPDKASAGLPDGWRRH